MLLSQTRDEIEHDALEPMDWRPVGRDGRTRGLRTQDGCFDHRERSGGLLSRVHVGEGDLVQPQCLGRAGRHDLEEVSTDYAYNRRPRSISGWDGRVAHDGPECSDWHVRAGEAHPRR